MRQFNKHFKLFNICLFLCFALSNAVAQIKIQKNLTVEDGLVQSQVISIYEDKDGYIWFGTYDGVSRWDGIDFVNYQSQDGLIGAEVYRIREHYDGAIHFTTRGGIINEYASGILQPLHQNLQIEKNKLTASFRSKNGDIFICIKEQGVSIYKNGETKILTKKDGLAGNTVESIFEGKDGKIYFITDSSGISVFNNNNLQTIDIKTGLASNSIYYVYESKDNTLFFITMNNGITVLKSNKFKTFTKATGLVADFMPDLYEASDSTIYFMSENNGVSAFKNGRLKSINTASGLISDNINAICEGPDGTIYFGTYGSGVSIYKNGEFSTLNKSNGLADDFIHSIFAGQNGTIYFGTDDGVSLYRPGIIANYTEDTGLASNYVTAILEGRDGTIYFGTFGDGLSVYKDGKFEDITEKDGLVSNYVYSLLEDKAGALYIGTWGGGVSVLEDGKFRSITTNNGLAENRIIDILESKDGAIYFATGGGVSIWREGKFQTLNEENGLACEHVVSLFESQDSTIYFGSEHGGVCKYKSGEFDILNEDKGLAANFVLSIYQNKTGTMFYATLGAGVTTEKDGILKTIDVSDGLSNNTVHGILEDEAGNIYLTTNKGINILSNWDGAVNVRTLRSGDGLASDETNQGAYFKDSQGKLWFGTIRGVTCYNPKIDTPDFLLPRVHISRMRVFEEEIPLTKFQQINLEHHENYLKFDFTGIDLSAPKKITYRYRLSGVDKDLVETQQRYVQYTNLDNGKYIFELKAKNQWGVWSVPAQVAFSISPPFWETWWFVLCIVLVFGGGVVFLVIYRVQQLLAMERLRTKIAADLHDNIGSSLTEISIISEVAASQLATEPKERVLKNLGKISNISRSLIDNMNDIVWLVTPKRDSLHDLIIHLRDLYTELFSYSGIIFKTMNLQELERVRLPMTYRQNLYLIFKEALNNSLKHSNCNEITLETHVEGRRLKMALTDDGKGFDQSKPFSGNGLENMKKRAENIGGKLNIHSQNGMGGTIIQFSGKLL